MARKDVKGIFVLFVIALISAFLYNHLSPSGIALLGQWEPSQGVVTANSKIDSVNASIEINAIKTIEKIVQEQKSIIIDVRSRDTYDEGHLPNALSFPLVEFDERVSDILRIIKRESPVLVYCSSIECSDSHTFAERLILLKYANVNVFSGGFRQWQEMGYEIEKTPK